MTRGPTRRSVLRYVFTLAAAGRELARAADAWGAGYAARAAAGDVGAWPAMPRRMLGRTGFEASRLIFGCGAALSRRPNDALLETAFEAGINVFDVGFRGYYRDAERHLAPFAKAKRHRIFLISKAMVELDAEPGDRVTAAQARAAAGSWLERLEGSLRELEVDDVDAYYVMASHNPSFIECDEILAAFERAKQAGKVRFLGLSTHRNAAAVLDAAARTGRYALAMVAITPAGWYDWETKGILAGSPPMAELQPTLARARQAGIGLVGMKAGRHLAGARFIGWARPDAFDRHYGPKLLASDLSPFQRSYAYVLAHGLDVVNADMQSVAHLRENAVAAAASSHYV